MITTDKIKIKMILLSFIPFSRNAREKSVAKARMKTVMAVSFRDKTILLLIFARNDFLYGLADELSVII